MNIIIDVSSLTFSIVINSRRRIEPAVQCIRMSLQESYLCIHIISAQTISGIANLQRKSR